MDDITTAQSVQANHAPDFSAPDFNAQVEAKKGLAIGIGTGAAIAGVVGLVMDNWMLAVIAGLISGFLIGRNAKP
jgi:hypothetical protein